MKELLDRLTAAEKETERLETLTDADPENESLDSQWDAAYKVEYNLYMAASHKIVEMTAGKIDFNTAKAMVKTKRAELENLFA